jgi:hypothetical protein
MLAPVSPEFCLPIVSLARLIWPLPFGIAAKIGDCVRNKINTLKNSVRNSDMGLAAIPSNTPRIAERLQSSFWEVHHANLNLLLAACVFAQYALTAISMLPGSEAKLVPSLTRS